MKTQNIFFAMAFISLTIVSCKKEKAEENNSGGTPTQPTSNYYVFDGVTYTGTLGWGQGGNQFNFFCTNTSGDQDLRLYFKGTTPPIQPIAGTYSVIADVGYITDSTTCSIKLDNAGTTYQSTGGGLITVGKSGTKTTYQFLNIPLSGSKNISGNFIY